MTDSPYAAMRITDFRLYVIARLMATMAVQIQGVAIGWQIYALTKDPLSLGLVGLSEALPALSISLYAGHIADILNRRLIAVFAISTLLISMILLFAFSSGLINGSLLVGSIYCVIALTGLARAFYAPSIFGIMADIIPRKLYGNAVAWNTTIWQLSAVAGPCLGGFLYVCFGPAKTYLTCAGFLFVSLISFLALKYKSTHGPRGTDSAFTKIKEGLRFTFTHEIVLGAMALDLFAVLFGGAVALLPMFTSEVYHCGPQVLGLLRAAPPVGAFLTAITLTHRPLADNAGVVLLSCVAGFGLCMIAFGLSSNLYLSLLLLAISGALDGVSVWLRNTIFQLATPSNMKGRMAAVNSMFIQSSNEIGGFESGVTAKLMGLVPSVVFGGGMTLLVVLITAFKAPRLRKLDMVNLYKPVE